MYKIIGADQKEYGPISADQMRQWLAEGRVNAQTLVWSETSGNWKPLASYPEFGVAAPGVPPSSPPPLGYAGGGGSQADALAKVSGPAIALMIAAGITILSALGTIGLELSGFSRSADTAQLPSWARMTQGTIGIVFNFLAVIANAFVIYGATKMKKLENYGMAMTASILSVIPLLSCCCIGLPVGIWALVVISKPEVKSQFR